MKSWLQTNWWIAGLMLWIVVADHLEPFKSSFGLAMLGSLVVGLVMGLIVVLVRKMKGASSENASN